MKNFLNILFLLLCLVCILTSGCGKKRFAGVVPAEGTVTYNGEPLDDAKVMCYAVQERADNVPVVAATDQNGRFVLRTNGEVNGAFPGSYKVVVSKSKIIGYDKNGETGEDIAIYDLAIPQKYSQSGTTDLLITIPPKGDKNLVITLE
jgi:hypothetical protein